MHRVPVQVGVLSRPLSVTWAVTTSCAAAAVVCVGAAQGE
jgi:hypothetical protein